MKFEQTLLLMMGIFAAVFGVCRRVIWRWDHYEQTRYDERQMEAQGRAAKTSLAFLLIYLGGVLLLRLFDLNLSNEHYDSVLWLGILIGIAVYATITIWLDAYSWLRTKWKIVVPCLLVFSAMHLIDMFDHVMSLYGIFVHLEFWLKIAVGVFFLYLALVVFIRMKFSERE